MEKCLAGVRRNVRVENMMKEKREEKLRLL